MPLILLSLRRVGCCLAAAALWAAATSAHAVEELDVKAALVANLLAFTEWPASSLPAQAALVLCVGADAPLRTPLATLDGRAIKQWSLRVHVLAHNEPTARCHALVVDDVMLTQRPALKNELRTLPLLSFADTGQAAQVPVSIRLDLWNGRVTFAIDLVAARANGITLSSRLLRLAREVHE
jgi:hypothetical protein